jgi:hypothetical protein
MKKTSFMSVSVETDVRIGLRSVKIAKGGGGT